MLVVRLTSGEVVEFTDCARWMTDESNNLCIYIGDVLCAMYNMQCWRSAVLEDKEG